MSIVTDISFFVVGLIALFLGGESLVKGASRLARILGINPVVIGLTVVAFGTSAPEFVVCLIAAFKGSSDIVLGNIVGSNISNIGLILGSAALMSPIFIQIRLIKVEVPIMIAISLVLYALAWNLGIGRIEGTVLFSLLIAFGIYSYFDALKEPYQVEEEYKEIVGNRKEVWKQIAFLVLGLGGLVIGARLVVDSAISMAKLFGVSELVISVTAVAVGTSLPELSTSIVAAIRKEHDIIVGNVIGSNIFNLGILGLVSIIHPINVSPALLRFEFPVMLFFSVLVIPIMKTDHRISRIEGSLLIIFYISFIAVLFV